MERSLFRCAELLNLAILKLRVALCVDSAYNESIKEQI